MIDTYFFKLADESVLDVLTEAEAVRVPLLVGEEEDDEDEEGVDDDLLQDGFHLDLLQSQISDLIEILGVGWGIFAVGHFPLKEDGCRKGFRFRNTVIHY